MNVYICMVAEVLNLGPHARYAHAKPLSIIPSPQLMFLFILMCSSCTGGVLFSYLHVAALYILTWNLILLESVILFFCPEDQTYSLQ